MHVSTVQCQSLGAAVSFLISFSCRAVVCNCIVTVRMAEWHCPHGRAVESQVSGILFQTKQ